MIGLVFGVAGLPVWLLYTCARLAPAYSFWNESPPRGEKTQSDGDERDLVNTLRIWVGPIGPNSADAPAFHPRLGTLAGLSIQKS